jgi:N-acetyl-beta-hexosaminidase
MAAINEEQISVINTIKTLFESSFTVLTNVLKDENYIANMFPDVILVDKTSKKPLFIIEVKRNGSIAQTIQQWKTVTSIPATLYIVVPESEYSNAQSIAQVVGLQTRFGTYTVANGQANVKFH